MTPPWTPGQWQPSSESSSSGSEEKEENKLPVDHVLDTYNGAMAQIAGLSKDASFEQLTFRMKVEWEKATEKEKQLCEEKVGEACRAVCEVIAPNASEELLKYFIKHANASNNELDAP